MLRSLFERQPLSETINRLLRRTSATLWRRHRGDGAVKIVVPTVTSAHYIDLILSYYSHLDIPVTVFVDSKTTDNTAAVAARYAEEVLPLENPSSRIGEAIDAISDRCGTPWVLRIDDDELPSSQMLAFAARVVATAQTVAVGFDRHQCVFNSTGEIFHCQSHSPSIHRQWRLYRPNKVSFHGRGHSPEFDADFSCSLIAPPDAFLIHLDWVVHSRAERMEKMARYDAHTPGHGTPFKDYYLGDESKDFRETLRRLPAAEFAKIGRRLVARFPDATVTL